MGTMSLTKCTGHAIAGILTLAICLHACCEGHALCRRHGLPHAHVLMSGLHCPRGEELGASVHATRKQMQSNMGTLPQPNRFAHEMREYFEQHIPFIGGAVSV